MPEALPADIPAIRRRYDEVRISQRLVRALLDTLDWQKLRESPWSSGRNLWGTLSWWLAYRRPFLNLIQGATLDASGMKGAPRGFTREQAWAEWDETTAIAEHILNSFTAEQWNADVDFWNGPSKTRRVKAWELFVSHFANRLAMDWTGILEDLCKLGYRDWVDKTLGEDWWYFRPGENIQYFNPAQEPVAPPKWPGQGNLRLRG